MRRMRKSHVFLLVEYGWRSHFFLGVMVLVGSVCVFVVVVVLVFVVVIGSVVGLVVEGVGERVMFLLVLRLLPRVPSISLSLSLWCPLVPRL